MTAPPHDTVSRGGLLLSTGDQPGEPRMRSSPGDHQAPALGLHQSLGEGQPDPMTAAVGVVPPPREDIVPLGQARTLVLHIHREHPGRVPSGDGHRAAAMGERIGEEHIQDLPPGAR